MANPDSWLQLRHLAGTCTGEQQEQRYTGRDCDFIVRRGSNVWN
jgi:hypothetical protein